MVHMTNSRVLLAAVLSYSIASFGCGNKNDFDGEKAKSILEANPVNLDAEQITLSPKQVDCGVQAELWERPIQASQQRTTAHLDPKGRDLKFNDDVAMEPDFRQPYVQVRGAFQLEVAEVTAIRDGDENGTKVVEAKAGVKIPHSCFESSLPIMGVKRGNFQQDTSAAFLFRLYEDGWRLERLVH
jgi:hypothetical protein